jgi:hypothetical protein
MFSEPPHFQRRQTTKGASQVRNKPTGKMETGQDPRLNRKRKKFILKREIKIAFLFLKKKLYLKIHEKTLNSYRELKLCLLQKSKTSILECVENEMGKKDFERSFK